MNSIDLRQSIFMYFLLLLGSIFFTALGFLFFNTNSLDTILMLIFIILFFGLGSGGLSIYFLFFKSGKSGAVFFPDNFFIELSNGQKYNYQYSDIEYIGIQEMTMPGYVNTFTWTAQIGNALVSPISILANPELFQAGLYAYAIKFKHGINIPLTVNSDTYMYSHQRLNLWQDINKAVFYLSNLGYSPKKAKNLYYFLTGIGLSIILLPPLALN